MQRLRSSCVSTNTGTRLATLRVAHPSPDPSRKREGGDLSDAAVDTVGAAWGEIEITPTRWRSWNSANFHEMGQKAAGDLPSD